MPSNYEQQLTRIREESCRTEELFRARYSSGPPATAHRLARRWRVALSCEPLDWSELSAIREEARENKIPVVISTRVPTGRVFTLSATKGSALELQKIGCVLADNLNPQKARVLLMLALTKTKDSNDLQKYFYY